MYFFSWPWELCEVRECFEVEETIYGLMQLARAWYDKLSKILNERGFRMLELDYTLMYYCSSCLWWYHKQEVYLMRFKKGNDETKSWGMRLSVTLNFRGNIKKSSQIIRLYGFQILDFTNKTHKNFEEDEQSDNIAAMLPEEV